MKKIEWKYVKARPSRSDIRRVEASLGVSLPEDYLKCVKRHNGGRPQPCAFDAPGRKSAVFQHLLRIDPDAENGVTATLDALKDHIPAGYVPFAADPFGNYLCFEYPASGEPQIVFWDHESEGSDSLLPVSPSFSTFLDSLYEPTE